MVRAIRRIGSSLSARLLLLVTLALAPALALVIYTGAEQRRHAIQEAQENALQLGRSIAFEHQMWVNEIRGLLISTSQIPLLREGEAGVCNIFVESLVERSEIYTSFYVIGGDGSYLCASHPVARDQSPLDQAWFRRALETRDLSVGDYQVDSEGNASIVFAYPLLGASGQQVDRVLAMAVSLHWISNRAAGAALPADSTLTVIDRNGTVLSRYPDDQDWVGVAAADVPVLQLALRQQREGTVSGMRGLGGEPMLHSFVPFGGLGDDQPLRIVVGIPADVVAERVENSLRRNLVGLALALALSLGAAWFLAEVLLMRQVRSLVGAARTLAAGDLSARSGVHHDTQELGQLADAFDHMAAALEHREAERVEAERQRLDLARAQAGQQWLRALVDTSPAAVFVMAAATRRVLLANQEWRRIYGVSSTEEPNEEHLNRVVYRRPNGTSYLHAERPEARALLKGESTKAEELTIEPPDGRRVPVLASAIPLFDLDGAVDAAVVVLQDTSRIQEIEKMRTEFLGMVGHELRTPLAVVKMAAASLQLSPGEISHEEVVEAAETIDQQADRLSSLIENLRDAVQIDAGAFSVDPVWQDIVPVLQDAKLSHERRSKVPVHLDVPAALPAAPIDGTRFLQVLENLLNNAARYSPEDVPIIIRVDSTSTDIIVRVTNRGPGIPKEQQDYLFRKFSQITAGGRSQHNGSSGLGLAICKGIVEAHRGSIWVESAEDAEETTFAFTLPLQTSPDLQEARG